MAGIQSISAFQSGHPSGPAVLSLIKQAQGGASPTAKTNAPQADLAGSSIMETLTVLMTELFTQLLETMAPGLGVQTTQNPQGGEPLTSSTISSDISAVPEGNPAVENGIQNGVGGTLTSQSPAIQEILNRIGNDPEGAIILKQAHKLGTHVEIGTPENPMARAQFDPTTRTITVRPMDAVAPNGQRFFSSYGDYMEAIAHELGHAATPEDKPCPECAGRVAVSAPNSKDEEGEVTVLAKRIVSRQLNGRELSRNEQLAFYQDKIGRYTNLNESNSIDQYLLALGIQPITI